MSLGIGPTADLGKLAELRAYVATNPQDLIARHNFAVELRKADLSQEGLREIEKAWSGGLQKAETALMLGNLLADTGQFDRAVEACQQAIDIKPELIEAHAVLASLLPQLGRASEALDSYRWALKRLPQHAQLWAQALATAHANCEFDQLHSWAEEAERRWGPDVLLRTYRATALSGLDRDADALAVVDAVLAEKPDFLEAMTLRAFILMRTNDPTAAASAALDVAAIDPSQQPAWAVLGTAWRLLDDPREHWLCNYDDFVLEVDVGLDPALPATLERLHLTTAHPSDQSLRGGTQTLGNLFETRDPVILATAKALRDAIEAKLSGLPVDPDHPFLVRNTGQIGFPTSWSARLASSGKHISHIHPVGWLSSAYYVELPDEVTAGSGQGCLTFGIPDATLKLDLPPRRVVQPKVGQLVLFPSYLWHGTTSFESERARMTIAFDMLPVDDKVGYVKSAIR